MRSLFLVAAVAACGGSSGGGDDAGPTYGAAHPRIYLGTNKDRLTATLASGAPAAMKFKAVVDRWVGGEDVYAFPVWNAALMGQLTGDAKYCTAAVAAIDKQVAAANAAIAGGSTPDVASDDYLAIGDSIGDLAMVYDWCYDAISGDQRLAWLGYADQAVYNVWNHESAKWGDKTVPWTGWAVDDPSDNYYYSFMRATMLLGLAAHDELADANGWLLQFHDTKLMGELVPTFEADLQGGGSREGTGYGVAMRRLFEMYDFWHASTGEVIATKTEHTRASMLSFMHQTLPTLDRIAPTGDQSRDSTASFFDYHRNYLQELVSLYPDDALAGHAQALLASCSVPEMDQQFMYGYDFLYDRSDVAASSLDGLNTTYYAPGIGELYTRSGWDEHATWVNLIAGPYTQSHAHQDQGAIMIYKDGWLAYDPVVDSHSGLTQDVTSHSTLRIGSGGQSNTTDSKLVALHAGDGYVYAAADLAAAYGGDAQRFERELLYLQPDIVVVYDRVASTQAQTWQLAMPKRPTLSGASATMSGAHALHVQRLAPAAATASVHDYSSDGDFSNGFRLDEAMPAGDQRYLHVLSIDGAATSVTANGADGATIVANGKTYTVAFSRDAIGATLQIGGQTVTLGSGIDKLPE